MLLCYADVLFFRKSLTLHLKNKASVLPNEILTHVRQNMILDNDETVYKPESQE